MPELECGFGSAELLFTFGPTTYVAIGFDPDRDRDAGIPTPPGDRHAALVDTGAVESCIDEQLAERLGLPAIDRRTIAGVSGPMDATFYAAQISFPELGSTLHGVFSGVRLTESGQPHLALLGRDLLRHFTMAYDGRTGRVTLSDDE